MKSKYIAIRGYIEIPFETGREEFLHKFYELIKSEGWHFAGTTNELFKKEEIVDECVRDGSSRKDV